MLYYRPVDIDLGIGDQEVIVEEETEKTGYYMWKGRVIAYHDEKHTRFINTYRVLIEISKSFTFVYIKLVQCNTEKL